MGIRVRSTILQILTFAFILSSTAFSQNFQKIYIEAMKAYDSKDPLKALQIIDEAVRKYTTVPTYFYVKALFYLKESFYANSIGHKYIVDFIYRYYWTITEREIVDEVVWESMVEVSAEFGLSSLVEEELKNLLVINPSNAVGLYNLMKLLFYNKNYEAVVKLGSRFSLVPEDPKTSEILYFMFLSKLYIRDYRNFDELLQVILHNYRTEEMLYVVSSIYYQLMEFDKAWSVIAESGIVDPSLYLKLMIVRKNDSKKISEFLRKYQNKLDEDTRKLGTLISSKGYDSEELKDLLKRKLLSEDIESLEPVLLKLALDFPRNSELYYLALEKEMLSFFSKKLYTRVVNSARKSKVLSKKATYILALSLFELREYRKSLELLEKVKNHFYEASVKIPLVYIELGNIKEARDKAKGVFAHTLFKGSDVEKYILSQVFLELGEIQSAERIINSVKNTNSYYYKVLSANIHFLKKNYSRSEEILKELLVESKFNSDIMNSLAYIWAEQGKNLKLALSFSKLSLVFEENYHYFDTLAYVYYRIGKIEMAKEYIERSIYLMEKENKSSRSIYLRAYRIYRELGDDRKSRLMLSKASKAKL
ncbi:MAG: hypothetical protein ABDH28_07755 [Brevinematia bacterium]